MNHAPTTMGRALVALSFAGAVGAQAPVALEPGVSESFARLLPARMKTFFKSSTDPDDRPGAFQLGNDDGFSGINDCDAYRQSIGGEEVHVLADVEGRAGFLGQFSRNLYCDAVGVPPRPQDSNRTQIVIDGLVAHDLPLPDYFRAVTDPLGQVAPFAGPFTARRAGGYLTHTPIEWRNRLVVRSFQNSFLNAAKFHIVAGTLASPDDPLEVPDLVAWNAIASAPGSWPHRTARVPRLHRLVIPAGGSSVIASTGPATILELTAKVGSPADWHSLTARFSWDGRPPSVDGPLRMLAGVMEPPFSFAFDSLLCRNNGSDELTSWFPMPFWWSGRLEFVNTGQQPIALDVTLCLSPELPPSPWGYYTAVWKRAITKSGVPFQGPRLSNVRGMLRALFLENSVNTSGNIGYWDMNHQEGDLCVRINGNRGDDHTFGSTEASIGKWGWYATPVDVPFSSDGSFSSGQLSRFWPNGVLEASRMQGSTFVFDPIHFVSGIDLVLEHGPENRSNADYGLLAVLYLQDGPAREAAARLDVGDEAAEAAHAVEFGSTERYELTAQFYRDPMFGTPPLTDDVREIRDWYRFAVRSPALPTYRGLCVAFRVDRPRTDPGGRILADVLVDGQRAGLLACATGNAIYRWKEGGELEVELPRALTDGKGAVTIEVRPRPESEPLAVGEITVYGYTKR